MEIVPFWRHWLLLTSVGVGVCACGGTEQDQVPATDAGAGNSGGSGGSGGSAGSGVGGSAGQSPSCQPQCVGPHTSYDNRYGCECETVFNDTDPDLCKATCVFRPIDRVEINVFIGHPTVGDLTVKLVAPDGTIVTLLNRPGFAESADDGADGLGAVAAIQKDMMVWFDATGDDAEALGAGQAAGELVCGGGDECHLTPAAGAAGGPTLETFVGKSAAGPWKICAGDSNPGGAGVLYSIGLFIAMNEPYGSTHTLAPAGRYPNGVTIPDGTYDGTIESMGCDEIEP